MHPYSSIDTTAAWKKLRFTLPKLAFLNLTFIIATNTTYLPEGAEWIFEVTEYNMGSICNIVFFTSSAIFGIAQVFSKQVIPLNL